MLACLPAPSDLPTRLLSRTQMNTGLQKWETTQKMRSANYPTPAELDAYAKRVANNPLTIQIFPSSVKVPQRKHVRRTVNGLDTLSAQRHSPYPSQVSATVGLLAVLRAPNKSFIKDSNGGRGRLLHKAVMNPHGGSYATQSTLNISQPTPDQHGLAQTHALGQTQGVAHPQMLLQQPQTLPHPQALQQRSMAHPQALQRQQSLQTLPQGLAHQQGLQRQQSFPHTQSHRPQQNLPHLQQQTAPHNTAALQQGLSQDLRLMSDGAQPPSLQHPQALPGPQVGVTGPPAVPNSLQPQHLPGAYGSRKITDADAPPNVTVSTSTIPLSMAASLHQNRPSDLSSIVHQINQFCQARAGMGITSVCEGQIANPSPISRNLLINASSRVSTHNPAPGPGLSCLLGGGPDKVPSQNPAAVQSQPSAATRTSLPAFHPEVEQHQRMQQQLQKQKQQQQLQQQHQLQMQQLQQQQQQQQQQRSWAQHQLAHLQQPPEGAHPCKNPRREGPSASGFPSRNISYPHKLPSAAQSFPLKHPADKPHSMSPISGPVGSLPYTNGHYMQPPWPRIPASANNNCSGPQELQRPFHGSQVGPSTECMARQQYRQGATGPPGQAKLVPSEDFLGGDFQVSTFNEQNLGLMEKIQMTPMGQEPSSSRGVHTHHPGYL